jgi:hypothetical protein
MVKIIFFCEFKKMSEAILYSPECFHGVENRIFQDRCYGCPTSRTLQSGGVLNAELYLGSEDSKGWYALLTVHHVLINAVHHVGAVVRADRLYCRGLRILTHSHKLNADVEKLSLVDASTCHKQTSLNPDTSTFTEIKYSRVRQFSYSAGVIEDRKTYKILVDKSEGRRPLRRQKW